MKRFLALICLGVFLAPLEFANARNASYNERTRAPFFYSERICSYPQYKCKQVKRGQTWESLFRNPQERDVIKRINRMNVQLRPGMIIAVPRGRATDEMAYAPFPYMRSPSARRTVIFDPKILAWGAYNEEGRLVDWGPASGGQNYCHDVRRGCRTSVGNFIVKSKKGGYCKSSKFPVGEGGAPMPYCVFFNGGYALHGSPVVPGYNASHGCVRLFSEDARWLNQVFIEMPGEGRGPATEVIVLPYRNYSRPYYSEMETPRTKF